MAWYSTNWAYRKKISINPQTMSMMAPLTNYPVYVNLSNLGSDFFNIVKSDGSDIRITTSDEVTEVPFELVFIDKVNQVGELYFKASAISETVVTDFYIYFGNASASAYATNATYGRNNVWTNGFLAVWHLHETPSTSSHTLLDSTGNGWDLRASAATVTRNTTTKKIGQNSIQFAGGYLYTANSTTYSQPITHEAWFQTSATSNQTIFGNGQDVLAGRRNLLMFAGTQTQHTENGGDVRANSTIGINTWHYVGALKTPAGGTGSVAVYNNGSFQTTTQISTPSTTAASSGALRLGANASGTELLTGYLDEARMQTVQRNQLWMSATYTNFNAPLSFYSIGSLQTPTATAAGWFNNSWLCRKKITIGAQTSVLNYFPVYVNLANLGSDFFSNVKTDGGDIRVTLNDGVTEIPRELVSINTGTLTGELYFRADNLSNSTSTDFYIYFGNASASNPAKTDTYGAYNVWNPIYRIVYHFNEYTPAGNIATGTNFINSASNGFSASVLGTPAVTSLNNGPIGKSLDVDGTNYYLTVGDSSDMTEYTISTYIKPTATNGAITVKNAGTDNSNGSFSENLRITSSKFEHYYFDGATATISANSTITLGSYFHVVGTAKNGGTGYIYQNGTQQTATDSTGTLWTGGDTFNLFGRDGSKTNWFLGQVEEFRIAPIQLSGAWVNSEYNNLTSPSTFYAIGSLQLQNPPQIQSLSPAIGSTGNAANTNLVLDFDQNVTVGTGNVTIEQIPNLNIGGTFQGDLAELMMLNTLTDSDRQKIEGYLAWKWFGGNNNLPSNHPYKLYAPRN